MTGTPSCLGAAVVPPVVPVPPPPPVVTPPVVKPPVVTPPVVTPLVVTPPVVTPLVVTPPVVPASTPCRVISSSVKVRSLSSLLPAQEDVDGAPEGQGDVLGAAQACSSLGKRHGAVLGRASVFLKKGTTKTILVHLTRTGRALIANKASAKIFVTTRTPAVKGLRPARTW